MRDEWGAKPPKEIQELNLPVPYVIIHHTYIPGFCNTPSKCIEVMKGIQRYHQEIRGWADIGYK